MQVTGKDFVAPGYMDSLATHAHDLSMGRLHIKEWRQYREMTQERLAEQMGIDASTLSRHENGKINYTQSTVETAAIGLNCEPADLFHLPPTDEESQLWQMIRRMSPAQIRQALKIVDALADEDRAA